jgi:hypothetical protein
LSGLAIGTLQLVPEFDPEKTSYTANTSDATNKVTVVLYEPKATATITVNGLSHTSGTSATWLTGLNTVAIHVRYGTTHKVYSVAVTKAGTLGSLTVESTAGEKEGETTITVTEPLTAGCRYKYKTGESVDSPALDDDLSDWDDWDGESDIAATTGHDIVIAEVSITGNLAKKAGSDTVAANDSG